MTIAVSHSTAGMVGAMITQYTSPCCGTEMNLVTLPARCCCDFSSVLDARQRTDLLRSLLAEIGHLDISPA